MTTPTLKLNNPIQQELEFLGLLPPEEDGAEVTLEIPPLKVDSTFIREAEVNFHSNYQISNASNVGLYSYDNSRPIHQHLAITPQLQKAFTQIISKFPPSNKVERKLFTTHGGENLKVEIRTNHTGDEILIWFFEPVAAEYSKVTLVANLDGQLIDILDTGYGPENISKLLNEVKLDPAK